MKWPLDECDACGADLYLGVVHDCPVLGAEVVVTEEPPDERD
jgi:hypothetical protein